MLSTLKSWSFLIIIPVVNLTVFIRVLGFIIVTDVMSTANLTGIINIIRTVIELIIIANPIRCLQSLMRVIPLALL